MMQTPGVWPLTLTAASIAIYGCVPETTHLPAFGLMTIGLAIVEVATRQRSAPIVFCVAAALVLWAGLFGATGRESAIVGAIFAFWPVVIVPIVTVVVPGLRRRPELVSWVISAIGAVAAVGVARTSPWRSLLRPRSRSRSVSLAGHRPLSSMSIGDRVDDGRVAFGDGWLSRTAK
jgi:hypothetical protein